MRRGCTSFHVSKQGALHAHVEDAWSIILQECSSYSYSMVCCKVCTRWMQVTEIKDNVLSFDVIVETLRATNLGALQVGSPVNFERSARVGDEIGGHNVSGHVATTATVASIKETADNRVMTFKVCGPCF
jgi:riboflavin synthase alpha subunit